MSNIIRLSGEQTMKEWLDDVIAEAHQFEANCGVAVLWNAEQKMVVMRHPSLTQAQGALMAIDCIKMMVESREFVESDDD